MADDEPPGKHALNCRPPRIPPARSITCLMVVPSGTSYTPGRATCPLTEMRIGGPWRRDHSLPLARIHPTWHSFSTFLTTRGRVNLSLTVGVQRRFPRLLCPARTIALLNR